MSNITFEWDPRKDSLNRRKHGVSFVEAKTVFYDEKALLIHDPDSSNEEDRFILLGMSQETRVLLVCHCYRENDKVIRLISARKASQREKEEYLKGVL